MNPLQQMNLAQLDHQERLFNAHRNRWASQLNRKSWFNLARFARKQQAVEHNNNKAGVKHGAVAVG